MTRQYAPKAVLRHLPLDLLRRFLDLQDIPTGPAWDTLADGDTRSAYQAWLDLSPAHRDRVEQMFRHVHEMGTPVLGLEPRAFVACPEYGPVRVDPGRLRRWAVRLPALADAVARAVRPGGGAVERIPGRVWRLGPVRAGGRVWAGFLAAGLARPDGTAVVAGAPELRAASAAVFVPVAVPPAAIWPTDRHPAVVPLTDFLSLGADGLVADRAALDSALFPSVRALPKASANPFPTPPGTDWEGVELVVGDHRVTVRAGGVVRTFGFVEAGFEDRRKGNVPDDGWAVLKALPLLGGDRAQKCWTLPECDAAGAVSGINRRFLDGSKKMMPGGKRGLTLVTDWRDTPGPVYLVEGASDTLALTAAGLAAVGRPSNTGGVDHLTALLAKLTPARDVVVVGENDRKPDGSWPGRDGAERTAAALGRRLGRPVRWALPPDGAKDAREWLTGRVAARTEWAEAGRAFAAGLVEPSTPAGTGRPSAGWRPWSSTRSCSRAGRS